MKEQDINYNFEGFDIFADQKARGRKRKDLVREGAANGLPIGTTRYTIIIDEPDLETIRDYAYTERIPIRDVFAEMVQLLREDADRRGVEILDRNVRRRGR